MSLKTPLPITLYCNGKLTGVGFTKHFTLCIQSTNFGIWNVELYVDNFFDQEPIRTQLTDINDKSKVFREEVLKAIEITCQEQFRELLGHRGVILVSPEGIWRVDQIKLV